MNQEKKLQRSTKRHLRPRGEMNTKPNGASFAPQAGALRGARVPTERLASDRPVHHLSNADREIIDVQIRTGVALRPCDECGRPLTPDHFHAGPARSISEITECVIKAHDEVTSDPPRSADQARQRERRSHAEINALLRDLLYEPALEEAARREQAGLILATIRATHRAIDTFSRKVEIARRLFRRYSEEPIKPIGPRAAKRALVRIAIDVGLTDAQINRDLGVSRDMARDERRNSSSSGATRDKK